MSCYLLMAVRPIDEGKSRLASTLTDSDRFVLNINMFRHVFSRSMKLFQADRIVLISRSPALLAEAREAGAHGMEESGGDLNAALTEAARFAQGLGATTVISLSSDLPLLTSDDLGALAAAKADVVVATDRAGIGTNAMLVRPPLAIPYLYGTESRAAHLAAAQAAGLSVALITRPGLARDIDTPDDLAEPDLPAWCAVRASGGV